MQSKIIPCKGKIVQELIADPNVEYRPIAGFPAYAIGSDGSVWSLTRTSGIFRMTPRKTGVGYLSISLFRPKEHKQTRIHVLVLEAFVGPRPEGMSARHLDGNRENNQLSNLQWGTPLEQSEDQRRHGTRNYGQRNGQSKLKDSDIPKIKQLLFKGVPAKKVADIFEVSHATITRVANNTIWAHTKTEPVVLKQGLPGEKHPQSKLKEAQVVEIFKRAKSGEQRSALAREFRVTTCLICFIANGRAWTHVTRPLAKKLK